MFAQAREAAGVGADVIPGTTVSDVLEHAIERYGTAFADVLGICRIWVNGEPADPSSPVGVSDEVAVLPPVSGGAA